jgi:threonylcarbamoyladenosine tRNA methylthiotransferase MtaB
VTSLDIQTFGCRLNAFESEIMRNHANAAGLDDAVIFNSCAVTAEATRQLRQAIRKSHRERPDASIIVTGCAAQTEADVFAKMPEVSRIIGNEEKLKAETWLPRSNAPRVNVSDIMQVRETNPPKIDGLSGRTRAFVQVQNGCDHRCTFCIIPFGRGNSRSVSITEAVDQVRRVVDSGHVEVVLSGVDLTSWGADLEGTPRLGTLINRILKSVPGLQRLRLSSIDSIEADEELISIIASEPRVMPHLHLSLQSGDNMILKRMKRRHTREDAIEICKNLKAQRPDMTFGADIIAGFPTETDEMFENSLRIIEECELTFLHVFPYSPRPDTPAARMPQLDQLVIKQRAQKLRAAGEKRLHDFLTKQKGQRHALLMETAHMGRTEQFASAHIVESATPGEIVMAEITGQSGTTLQARLV